MSSVTWAVLFALTLFAVARLTMYRRPYYLDGEYIGSRLDYGPLTKPASIGVCVAFLILMFV